MAGINVKWPGQYVAEDTTHRLVTDEQIEFWNSNGVIELTPDNYKDYVIDEEDLYTPVYDAYNARGHFIENLQPGHYKVKLGYDILLEPPENSANNGIATLADDGGDIDRYWWQVKPDWVDLFANVYYDIEWIDNHILYNNFAYDYSSRFDCKSFGCSEYAELIEYVEFEVFEKKDNNLLTEIDYNCVVVSNKHMYYKYDTIVNGVQEITDWNDAIKTGVYKSYCSASDAEDYHMPLSADYTDIDLNVLFKNSYHRYIGRVINSGEKITQEVEFDINPCGHCSSSDFMKALGTKFIRYGFYRNNEIVWTNWYSINYDLGECDPNIRRLFASDT